MAVQTDWSRRTALCDWLTANGIEPNTVPVDGDLLIVDTEQGRAIRVEVHVVDEHGRKTLDERGQNIATEIRTVPLAVEPPPWFESYEKPTREELLATVERVRDVIVDMRATTGARAWADLLDTALDGEEQR